MLGASGVKEVLARQKTGGTFDGGQSGTKTQERFYGV